MSDLRVCMRDGEPLVWTFEFPGAEYHCVVCGGLEDMFGLRAPATPTRQARLDELTEQYQRGRAERTGVPYRAPQRAGDDGVKLPVCGSCGVTPEPGIALTNGKPAAWFSRTINGTTEYACSRSCIKEGAVLPW